MPKAYPEIDATLGISGFRGYFSCLWPKAELSGSWQELRQASSVDLWLVFG